jgi:aldehyde:ferredoxin oxidoreductase
MAVPKGFAGQVAIIDLTKKEAKSVPTDAFWKEYDIDPKLWLGGDGVITKILWKDFPRPIDPLGPENEVIVATGPWNATAAPWAGRGMLGCISPEHGGFSSGSFGWHFLAAMKWAGYDYIIVRGKAEKPVYIFLDNQEISIRDASRIWGKETGETVKAIRTELQERFEAEIKILSISVAGENLVKFAPPCTDGVSCPGRSSGGTIMGSKNLKAIAVRGTGEIALHDAKGLLDTSYRIGKYVLEQEPLIKLWREHGATAAPFSAYKLVLSGDSAVANRKEADFPHLNNVGCLNCMAPCYHWLQIKDGRYAGTRQIGGHMTFVTNCLRDLGIEDFGAWTYYERLIQELGMDPSSFTLTFGWACDCFEKGLLTLEDTDGLVLKRGDQDVIWEVARRIAHRQGKLGNLLADGIDIASKKVGKGSEEFAPLVKGKPYLQGDPKVQALIWSLAILVNPRGADWNRCHNPYELFFMQERRDTLPELIGMSCAEAYRQAVEKLDMSMDLKKQIFGDPPKVDEAWIRGTAGKAAFTIFSENVMAATNSMVTCMYSVGTTWYLVGQGPTMWAEVLNKITGWNVKGEDLLKAGERIFNLQRMFNYRMKGWTAKDDVWQDKRVYQPATTGAFRGKPIPWNETLQEYYAIRGWTKDGLPTTAKILELKMDKELKELQSVKALPV